MTKFADGRARHTWLPDFRTPGEERQRLQCCDAQPHAEMSEGQHLTQNASSETPIKMPAIVRLPMRQPFGSGEGRTLSVVNDMPRKSPAIITMIISMGVRSRVRS
jgi:hypothetical protein